MLPGSRKSWSSFLLPLAYAANQPSDKTQSIQQWVMPKGDINPYLNRLKVALDQACSAGHCKIKAGTELSAVLRPMVLATAWQETCWRQFVRSGSTVRCIVSYNQTSVGVMQINERVWRGIYRPESLRWMPTTICARDVKYLIRIAQIRAEAPGRTGARSRHACANPLCMYNGGPGSSRNF